MTLRTWLWQTIHHCSGPVGRAYAFFMIIIITISVALIPVEFLQSFTPYFHQLEWFIVGLVGVLTLDLILQVATADDRVAFLRSADFWWDAIALLPFFAEGELRLFNLVAFSDNALHWLHLLRLFLLFELTRIRADRMEKDGTLRRRFSIPEEEKVELVLCKHFLFLLIGLMPAIVVLLLCFLAVGFLGLTVWTLVVVAMACTLAIFFLYRIWQDYLGDVIILTDRRILVTESSLLNQSHHYTPYSRVTRVEASFRGITGWLFRYGSIRLEWRGGGVLYSLARNPQQATSLIRSRIGNAVTTV